MAEGLRLDVYVSRTAYVLLLLGGLIATAAIGRGASQYVNAVETAQGLHLSLADVRISDDENPRVILSFRLYNRSPFPIRVERYQFHLFLNGEWVGSSTSVYRGTDPDVDLLVYRKAREIDEIIAGHDQLAFEFILYLYSRQMEIVRVARQESEMTWRVDASFRALLPGRGEGYSLKLSDEFGE